MKKLLNIALATALVTILTSTAPLTQGGMTATGDVAPVDPVDWTLFTLSIVGTLDAGSVSVDDDSDLLSFYGTLGLLPGSSGSVTVSGEGATWTNTEG